MEKRPPKAGFLEQMFTRQERLALAFLMGVSFLGLGVMAWQRGAVPQNRVTVTRGDSHLLVAINRAGVGELTALPGVGPALAQRMVQERQVRGRYLTLEDLKRVKGIGPRTLERLQGLVRFD